MHLAIIIDEERFEQEQSMLNRLCIGLMAEGVHVTRIVPDCALPDSAGKAESRIALAPRIETSMRVLPWMRSSRISRIAEQLEKSLPDSVYAVGTRAWRLGIDLAGVLEKPVLIDVCSAAQARAVPKPNSSPAIAGYVACTGPIARMTGQRTGADLVSLVPMGVPIPANPRAVFADPALPAGIVILGRSQNLDAYTAMLEGLSRLIRQDYNLQIFMELRGRHEHDIWRRAERLDLLHCISIIGEASAYRSLLTRCDLLVMPERLGELRSIMLEAMAFGIPVIAAEDPMLDILVENESAFINREATADHWEALLRRVCDDRETAQRIGLEGHGSVASRHRSSDQIHRLIETLERAASGGTYRFQTQSP